MSDPDVTSTIGSRVEVTLFLADYVAEQGGGKLTAVGIGWDRTTGGPFGVGVLLDVGWNLTDRPHHLAISLLTEDGSETLRLDQEVMVGRPPGHDPGSPVRHVAAINFVLPPQALSPGRYVISCAVNDEELRRLGFRVMAPAGR